MSHSDIARSRHLVGDAIFVSAGSFASTTASVDPLALVHPDQLVLEKM
jgi:hypothetical protein